MSDRPALPLPAETLRAAYRALSAVIAEIDDDCSWLPTGCAGWSVRDLTFHCLSDAQRGLVALRTLAVEATIHHLDMIVCLPTAPEPSRGGLAQVRWCLDGLLGRPAPAQWVDAHYARVATGRARMSENERAQLGADAARFPLFG